MESVERRANGNSEDGTRPEEEGRGTGGAVESILMATDLSARSDRALERAVRLAEEHRAHLVVLNVLDEDLPAAVHDRVADAASKEIADMLARSKGSRAIDAAIQVVRGKDYRDIIAAATSAGTDLIVLGVHRNETGLKPIAGTTMERVIRHGRHPVLVVSDRVKNGYKNVMIGVDFSVYARFALRGAIALAPGAAFHAVHAYRVPFEGLQPGEQTRLAVAEEHEGELARMIDEEMDALIGASSQHGAELRLDKILRHGDADTVLRQEVERLGIDLLVLGTHGRVGLSHALIGSVAAQFLTDPPCDVMVVKAW